MPLYRAYGLTLDSELELPELCATDSGPAALTIRLGRIEYEGPHRGKVICRPVSDRAVLVVFEPIGVALVKDGKEITLTPSEKAAPLAVRLFLLQQVMAMALWQRDYLLLHAGAVVLDEKAVVFMGGSGQGKSTMVAAMNALGCPALCDDVLAIEMKRNGPMAQVGLTHLKLSEAARELAGVGLGEAQLIPDRSEKRLYALKSNAVEAAPLRAIFLLVSGERIEFQEAPPARALIELVRQSYGAELVAPLGKAARHFEQCAEIARTVPIFVLSRPRDLSSLRAVARQVIERVRQSLPS